MENNIKIVSDSLSDAMTVLQLLEVNVEQDEYDPYILRSLHIIDNLLHTVKTALPQVTFNSYGNIQLSVSKPVPDLGIDRQDL